jgi:hypothetical protein
MFKSDNKEKKINLDNLESNSKTDQSQMRQSNIQYKYSLYAQYQDLKSGKGLNLFHDLKTNKIGINSFFYENYNKEKK